MHLSPVHILHAPMWPIVELLNAAFSPFLVELNSTALALAGINLTVLKAIEDSLGPRSTLARKFAAIATVWSLTVALRVLLSYVFGRALGWAHPQWFATSAIHEVSAGKPLSPSERRGELMRVFDRTGTAALGILCCTGNIGELALVAPIGLTRRFAVYSNRTGRTWSMDGCQLCLGRRRR